MILPDINLLVHAHNLDSPVHREACAWWDGLLGGTTGVGLAWVTILGFIRITTHGRILAHPFRPEEAVGRVGEWLSLPQIHVVHPSDRHFERLATRLVALGTAGNLTTDAHLATLAIERGYILHTTDADFARFPGLRWENPLVRPRRR